MARLTRYLDLPAAMIGLVATVVSWAAGIPSIMGAAIGGLTFVLAWAGVALERRRHDAAEAARHDGDAAALSLGAGEERWVRRGSDAVSTIDACARSLDDGPLRVRLMAVADQARDVLGDVRTLAGQASATKAIERRLDASRLTADLMRLTSKLERSEEPEVEEDLRRSLDAVREQLGIQRRLETTRRAFQARVESGSLGLQRLAAQVSEMTALASPDSFGQQGGGIEDLSAQLEALRSGLNDAGALSRRALGRIETEGGGS
jgi:hypothetical protein